MNFDLTEDQTMIRDMVRKFADQNIRGSASEWDVSGDFPREVFSQLAELGLMGMLAPVEFGGSGLDAVSLVLVLEEIGRCDGGTAYALAHHNALALPHILRSADAELEARILPDMASGRGFVAWAGSREQRVRAARDEDHWVLNGHVPFVTLGSVADHAVFLAEGDDGLTAFLVPLDTEGIEVETLHDTLGIRCVPSSTMRLRDVRVPDSDRLGEVGAADDPARDVSALGHLAIAAVAVGVARGALEEANAYAGDRKQFGKPLTAFQAIQFKLADMATSVDAARLMVLRAALASDSGTDIQQAASQARLFSTRAATDVCDEAVQIHGGYGYTREYVVERYFRDSRMLTALGSTDEQRDRVADELGL